MKRLIQDPLPYSYDALEPVISKSIMQLHHDKHEAAYVNKANEAIEKLEKSRAGELEIDVKAIMRDFSFNYNGAVLHKLFWANMRTAKDNNQPDEQLRALIEENFLSVKAFENEFSAAAVGVEGSGWAVLWKDMDNNLSIGQLEKHNLLALNGNIPILVLDVWEHAYYLDYLNDRASYVTKWWQVVNWEDVNKRVWK
ncbi:hypothetical protein A2574_03675 [Candidatus Shapirobacteria bacterium RIFOXYD1_FULL_38_32]|uniref:Superoxide dismutase n=2 Tax=Candidatus Shapironibacteriota TaxID=1752721 RepID=A0A1F7SPU8_9BACT|nr:MAG: Mn/fe Superoxide dismutase [Candidatus Shapirobacteria bacterium GW2011_GWE1_38_92]OGL55829.1 MAG: hypothetical protein A2367_02650 [Candidatus Shapirobacteria bacterium RIFOXYB1_FULL_38_38]OGL57654.1 MAG: hypothetical protein A2410_02340 [Candidatus Shapirobacteria bacterium RIFOXYC1_FULL_38_24]OGL58057.1 MAG: hypothetical protein A2574_03675 [Candidatus Shapirobacteria bacterium RIFOXYD1_FULL_38_32]HAP37571.1 superoxide dismutase [Candidatus Shapirobacteria bacterium]